MLPTRTRFRWTWPVAVTAALFAVSLAAPARGDLREDRAKNYVVETPEDWSWLPGVAAWKKQGIVVGAVRELEKVKTTGKPAKGEGGWMHLAITDAPEDKDLDALAADEEVRGFLMTRFGAKSDTWPSVDVTKDEYESGMKVRILIAKGESPNLKGRKNDTHAVMLLTVVKKKLYKLRLYAWHTEFDDEGLKSDLDLLEMNFDIPDLKEDKKPEDGVPPPAAEEDEEPVYEGDEGEEKTLEFPEYGIKLVKPRGIQTFDFDKDKYPDAIAWFQGSDHSGSYQMYITVFRRGRVINGRAAPDADIREWITKKWWPVFTANHPDGPLSTYKWPKKSSSFITLPDFDKERVVFEKPERRPAEVGSSEMVKKLKIVEKVKNQKLGREKTNETYRGVMRGVRPRLGREIVIRFAWGTSRVQCEMTLSLARGGEKKWGDEVRQLLESIEMTGRK